MAILDTEYVKAPSLRAGDFSITKSSTGFSMSEGDTIFLTGSADGTLTIGKENLTSSIPTLYINARDVYWNNRPLEDYWAGGGSGTGVPDLTQDVTRLQELTTANTQAIQATDERLSQEISELRLDALGAKINILANPINNYVSNICGVAVPATLLKEALPYFNKITLNNVQNSGTGYLAIYSCTITTPTIDSECTLLYVSEEAFETTGAPTAPTSSVIKIPEKINIPDSGLILLIFSSSATAPQADSISWVTGENSTMVIRLGIYSPGATNRPYDTNGVYVLQKVTNAAFLTYSPDIDFSYVYDETESILSEDIEEIKSQIVDLGSAVEDLRSDVDDRMTYDETVEVVVSQIEELKSDLGGGMTYEETIEAIAEFPDDNNTGRLYNLGSLVDALTTGLPLTLVKETSDVTEKSFINFNRNLLDLINAAEQVEDSSRFTSMAALKLASGIAYLSVGHSTTGYYPPGYYNLVDTASLNIRNIDSGAGVIDLKSIYNRSLDGTATPSITYLTTGPGKLELGIQDDGQDLFQLSAKYQDYPYDEEGVSGVQLIAKSRNNNLIQDVLLLDPPYFGINSRYESEITGTSPTARSYISTGPYTVGMGIYDNGQDVFKLSADYERMHLIYKSHMDSDLYSDLHMTSSMCDIRSYYKSMLTGTTAQASTYLTTGSGAVSMGIKDNNLDLFKLSANSTGVWLKSMRPTNSSIFSELYISPSSLGLNTYGLGSGSVSVSPSQVTLTLTDSGGASQTTELSVSHNGLAFSAYDTSIWDTKLDSYSTYIPTISIVHYLIQQALANQ